MKHVFLVHSPITYLSALGVVLKEKIEKKNVLIVSESFRLEDVPIDVICIQDKLNIIEKNLILNKFINFPLRKINKYLDTFLSGQTFVAYISVFITNNRFVVTHNKCEKFNFIEEGLAAYNEYYDIRQLVANTIGRWDLTWSFPNFKKYLRELFSITFKYPSKINAIPTHYTAYATNPYICFYGFTEFSFPVARYRKMISMQDVISSYDFKSRLESDLNGAHIWIGDPDIYREFNNFELYLQAISDSYIKYLKNNGIHKIFVKFHYREDKSYCKKLLYLFDESGIEYEVLQNIIMEVELSKCKNITLVGFRSSLLLYGKLMGHKSFSIIKDISESHALTEQKQKSILWKFVAQI